MKTIQFSMISSPYLIYFESIAIFFQAFLLRRLMLSDKFCQNKSESVLCLFAEITNALRPNVICKNKSLNTQEWMYF